MYIDSSSTCSISVRRVLLLTKKYRQLFFVDSAGFTIFWDFLLGMHPSFTKCRLAVGIYDGTTLVTEVKVFPLARVTTSSRVQHLALPPGGLVLLGLKHPFPR